VTHFCTTDYGVGSRKTDSAGGTITKHGNDGEITRSVGQKPKEKIRLKRKETMTSDESVKLTYNGLRSHSKS